MTPNINAIMAKEKPRLQGFYNDKNEWVCTGAMMGCGDNAEDLSAPLYVQRVWFIDGDYAADGTYWGGGSRLYCAFNPTTGARLFRRGKTRQAVMAEILNQYPDVAFLKSGKKTTQRAQRLIPGGVPKWVRIYDNGGETADRYTIVFTKCGSMPGQDPDPYRRRHFYLGASAHPFHPQGIGQHGESVDPIDRPAYGHLGKPIAFDQLPPDVKKFTLSNYCELWGIEIKQ